MIEYEKLKVYRTSLACVELVIKITENIPRGFSELRNQLHRAIFSVSLNIAEGAGRSERAEKKQFYAIARGSAMESAAVCDILQQCKIVDEELYREIKVKLREVIAMLSRMILNMKRGKELGQAQAQGQGK